MVAGKATCRPGVDGWDWRVVSSSLRLSGRVEEGGAGDGAGFQVRQVNAWTTSGGQQGLAWPACTSTT